MDNRRQTENPSTKPYNRNKSYSGGKSYGYNSYQSKDRNFQKRDDRFQDKENRYQDRNEKNDRYQGKSNGDYKSRDNRFQSRDSRFGGKPGNGRFNPKNKFQGKKGFFPKGKPGKPWDKDKERKPRIVSDMQVTEGKHRGKFLVSTASPKVRPTARRLREIMFRILYRKIRAKRFLDLCAGSGTVGIEAMSRGALLGTFVERSAKMCSFIRKNMATCGIKEGHGEVHEMEVVPFLKEMKKRKRCWDVVYFDPPYDADYDEVLKYLSRGVALEVGGVLVIEHHAEMFFPEKINQLKRWRVIVQGDSALSFFERK